jgi:hypothetical protein
MSHAANDRMQYREPVDSSKGEYDSYYGGQMGVGEEIKDGPQELGQVTRASIGKEEKKSAKSIWTSPSNNFPLFFYQQYKTPDKSPHKDLYEGSEITSTKTPDKLESMVEQWNKDFHLGDSSP